MQAFFAALDARIAPFDLLTHPFYQAWSNGELTHEDLREYAAEYWHHVSAFPTYLSALHSRLEDTSLRRTVLENLIDEEGLPSGRPHSDLWMDFATGMGARREEVHARTLNQQTAALIAHFRAAMLASPSAALATLYTYESRVPAIAATKADGLGKHYGADAAATRYFTLHQTADVLHAHVWREALSSELAQHPERSEEALAAAEDAAAALWTALDGVERERQLRMAQQRITATA
jgi:pyrroloquinoline-quinone synthase